MFIHYFLLPRHLGYTGGVIFRVTLESGCGRMNKLGLELGPEGEFSPGHRCEGTGREASRLEVICKAVNPGAGD